MARCIAGDGAGWSCKRPAQVGDLCVSHYKQSRRGRGVDGKPFTPLLQHAGREKISGVRVSSMALEQLHQGAEEKSLPLMTFTSSVLEGWAARRSRGKE